jgi:hypothetical protein
MKHLCFDLLHCGYSKIEKYLQRELISIPHLTEKKVLDKNVIFSGSKL